MNKKTPSKAVEDITQLPFETRKKLAERYMSETKGHFPFVFQKDTKSNLHFYEQPKILMITGSLKVMNLFEVFRKKNHLDDKKALFLFVNGRTLLKSDSLIADCYYKHKKDDGFVYLKITDATVLG